MDISILEYEKNHEYVIDNLWKSHHSHGFFIL